jgi:hypothetical protein
MKSLRIKFALTTPLLLVVTLLLGFVGTVGGTVAYGDPAPTNCGVGIDNAVCKTTTVDGASKSQANCNTKSCDIVGKYINPFITFLTALVGVAVTISIIIGGIQYGSSAGDPQKTSAAKNRIRNSIIALFAFMFLYTFLQFIVPGGVFKR